MMEKLYFFTVYIWYAAFLLDRVSIDFDVNYPHPPPPATSQLSSSDCFQKAYSFGQAQALPLPAFAPLGHTAGNVVQPDLCVPRLCTLTAETGENPRYTPQRSLPNQSGAHFSLSYKSILRDLASDKEILHVRILPVPRSFKTGLPFFPTQEAMNQPVDYLLCLLISYYYFLIHTHTHAHIILEREEGRRKHG